MVRMSEYIWCHGPECHTYVTTDRVRGSKGSKVLRTRKVKQTNWNSGDRLNMYSYFCSQYCYQKFADKYVEQIIRIAPRTEPLETRIEDPKKETEQGHYGTYTRTIINKLDESNNVG